MEIDEKIKTKNTAIPPDYRPLVDYDIGFGIHGETLHNLLDLANSVNRDIHFIFMKDCLLIRQQRDNLISAEIKINTDILIDYNPGLELVNNNEILDSKYVVIDIHDILGTIKKSADKDEPIIVKIDTLHYKRIEFILEYQVIVWTSLEKNSKPNKDLMSSFKISRTNDKSICAKTIIEPSTFIAILNTLAKSLGKNKIDKRDIDQRLFITLDKNGLEIISGDKLMGRRFAIKWEPNNVEPQVEFEGDIEDKERESRQQLESFKNPKLQNKLDNTKKIVTHKLLKLEAEISQTVLIESGFLIPFSKIKNFRPIHMEVRTDKPLVLEINPLQGVNILYSVGPRIESKEELTNINKGLA